MSYTCLTMTQRSQKVKALSSSKLFKNIDEEILDALSDLVQPIEIPKGDLLMRDGGVGRAMYVIAEGELAIMHENEVIAQLYKDDIVGELSLMAPIPRTAQVKALSSCTLYRIKRGELMHLLKQQPTIALNMIKVLTTRIIELNHKIYDLTKQVHSDKPK